MLRRVTLYSIEHARFTWLVLIAMLLYGIAVYLNEPRQEDPQITIRGAQVVTRLPGLAPERVEQLITRPIEERIKTIPEIKDIKSVSMTGLSIVTPVAADRYTDMKPIWSTLRNKMDDLAPQLPSGTGGPYVNDEYGKVAVITMALTGEAFSMAELDDTALDILDVFNTLPLVARVDLFGVQAERIWIDFDAADLAHSGITPSAIIAAISSQNVVLPGGHVEADGQSIVIEPSGDYQSLDELRSTAIETTDGQIVYLGDLASIRRSYVDPPEAPAFYNGKQAIVLGISMPEESNVVELGGQIQEAVDRIRAQLPLGMHLDVAIFQPQLVQASVHAAMINLLETVVVVLIVVMLFLGWRTGLIVGSMVPLTIMAALIGMSIWGIELHRISIAAIIVALGLLVDNGIVVAEQILKRRARGDDPLEAALNSVETLAIPLLTSSLTTIAAFMPLMMIKGGSGEFLRSLGQVLTMALMASWLISITITPTFCLWFQSPPHKPKKANSDKAPFDTPVYRIYRNFLSRILRFRVLFLGAMVLLLLSSLFVFSFVKRRSLGPSERNQFTVYIDLPAGASIRQTIAATGRLMDYLGKPTLNPEVTDTLAYVGSGGPRFFLALAPNDPQPNKAFAVVNTQKASQIHDVMKRVDRFMVEQIPEASGRTDILFLGPAALGTVELRISGVEIAVLRNIGEELAETFRAIHGTEAVRSDWENAVVKVLAEVDQERARRAGVTSQEIANTLSAYFDGVAITAFREGDKVIPILLRASEDDRATLDRLRTVDIYSVRHRLAVPLLQVADFSGEAEASRIRRFNQKRALTVAGRHPDMTAVELYAAMKDQLDAIELPPGYTLDLEGEIKGSRNNNRDLFRFAPLALFIIITLLILQFNSFRRSAIILLTIPLIMIGASYGLFLFGAFFDFTAMLGLFSLAGIIINNGIVMIARIEEHRASGLPVRDSITEAALSRARPIIMTTITTVIGLAPLALFGGEFWYGMAIVIMNGLGVGTLLTLGVVPVLYSLFFDRQKQEQVEKTA